MELLASQVWAGVTCIGILTGVGRVDQPMSCMIHDFAPMLRHEWGGMGHVAW